MKAAVFHGAGDIRVEEVPDPGHPDAGEVLLKTHFCGICGTDLHEFRHGPNLPTVEPHLLTGAQMPVILGHEFSAEVVEVGAGVVAVKPGDRVAVMPLFYCGECSACRAGRPQVCAKLGAVGYNWPWGGFGEYAIVQEHQVAVLPDSVSSLQGALVEPAAVAVHAVTTAGVAVGDAVFIAGGGPIGQLVALAALAAGAGEVIVAEPNVARRERLIDLGVAVAIDPAAEDPVGVTLRRFPDGVDIAFDCAGAEVTINTCLTVVRRAGTVLQTALHAKPAAIDLRDLVLRDIRLIGCNCFPVTSWPKVIRMIATGRLPVERIVTGETDLVDIVERGFQELAAADGGHVKVLVKAI